MSWLYSQALVGEYSGATYWDGGPSAQWSVMPTPQGFWRNDKMMDASRLSQFGPTLRLLTASHGEAVLTSFLAAFPARTYQAQDEAKELPEQDRAFGLSSLESLARYDPDTCLWRTPQYSLLGGLELFSETWPRWGTMQSGGCWVQPTWALRTNETEYGLLPTPSATEGGPMPDLAHEPRMNQRNYSKKTGNHCQVTLRRYVEMWPTPRSCSAMAATLTDKGQRFPNLETVMTKRDSETVGGQLNPQWVEWLMGWPIGWTDLRPLEMDKFQQWRQGHLQNVYVESCDNLAAPIRAYG